MKKILKTRLQFIAFFVFLLAWSILLFFVSPKEIVGVVGVNGGYWTIFFIALIGVSFFTSASFYTILITFASTGEFNPIILGLVAAPGLALGDCLFFLLGLKSRSFFGDGTVESFSDWIDKWPKWVAPIIAFAYSAFSPLPQDALMVAMGWSRIKLRYVILPLLLGNATFIFLVSYFAAP